jgi:hypothetical protein
LPRLYTIQEIQLGQVEQETSIHEELPELTIHLKGTILGSSKRKGEQREEVKMNKKRKISVNAGKKKNTGNNLAYMSLWCRRMEREGASKKNMPKECQPTSFGENYDFSSLKNQLTARREIKRSLSNNKSESMNKLNRVSYITVKVGLHTTDVSQLYESMSLMDATGDWDILKEITSEWTLADFEFNYSGLSADNTTLGPKLENKNLFCV